MNLRALLEARLAFDGNYFVGTEFRVGGARENKRLKPIHDALIECVEALETANTGHSGWPSAVESALANLEKLLREGTDE